MMAHHKLYDMTSKQGWPNIYCAVERAARYVPSIEQNTILVYHLLPTSDSCVRLYRFYVKYNVPTPKRALDSPHSFATGYALWSMS